MNEIKFPVKVIGYENRKSKDNTTWCSVFCATDEINSDNGFGRQVNTYFLHKECYFDIDTEYYAVCKMSTFNGTTTLKVVDIVEIR